MIYDKLPRPFLILAPMDDVTDVVFRSIVAECAAPDLFYTEFVNVDGLQSAGRAKLLPRLLKSSKDKPIIAQIWGLKPENFEITANELVEMGFDGIDLNFGCPDKTIVKNGACSALIQDRPKAAAIIAATIKGAAGRVPVSVKTRLGFSAVDLSWIEFVLGQNIDALTIHFRTRKEMSKVPAHWDYAFDIIELRDKIAPNTKIIGNGDVTSRAHALELAKKYNLDGIMIGRGVFADPFIFAHKSPWSTLAPPARLDLFRKHVNLFNKTWTENERISITLNKFCKIYINNFEGAKELRETIMRLPDIESLVNYLNDTRLSQFL